MAQSQGFEVPPPRLPGASAEKLDFNPRKLALTNDEYSRLFWYTDHRLTTRDRLELQNVFTKAYLYSNIGGFLGFALFAFSPHYKSLSIKAFNTSRVAGSVFFGVIGFEFGATVGQQVGLVKGHSRFVAAENEHCMTVMRLARLRPFLSHWRRYYSDGQLLPVLRELREYNERKAMWNQGLPDSTPAYDEWGADLDQPRRPTLADRVRNLPPPADDDPFVADPAGEFAGQIETAASFEREMELERRGQDQPDDFTASEAKYSQSKYD
ncbi:uncharacterized protein V1510DRAFT_417303 [Dipodascopsis tothii]|uniref:uncharacterized protein n=1 Tax=Dipodascopsis tothii TaxID=44089 RepID=UPI0034CE8A88